MSVDLPDDVHRAVQSLVASGRYGSEVDVVRSAVAALVDREADRAAIQEGLDDVAAGRTISLEQFDCEMRAAHEHLQQP